MNPKFKQYLKTDFIGCIRELYPEYTVDFLTDEKTFREDLGFDSLDFIEFVMEVEEEFNITIPDDEAENIKTIGEGFEFVAKLCESSYR